MPTNMKKRHMYWIETVIVLRSYYFFISSIYPFLHTFGDLLFIFAVVVQRFSFMPILYYTWADHHVLPIFFKLQTSFHKVKTHLVTLLKHYLSICKSSTFSVNHSIITSFTLHLLVYIFCIA